MSEFERAFRARVVDFVGQVHCPATRAQLVAEAQRGNVPSDVLAALLRLPDRQYASTAEVLAAVDQVRQAP